MKCLWEELRPLLRTIATSFINLLLIIPAMFTLQLLDRLLLRRSQRQRIALAPAHYGVPRLAQAMVGGKAD